MYQGASKKNKLPGRGFDIHSGKRRDTKVKKFRQNNCGAVESGAPSAEKGFASSLKATAKAPPSVEFHVWSDEGINLHVDLNSTPTDWANKVKREICPCKNVYGNKSGSLWQDLGCLGESSTLGKSSFSWNANSGQIDDHNGLTKSSSSLKLTKDGITRLDQHNRGDSPLIYDLLTPCSKTVNVADKLKENQSTVSAEPTVNVAGNLKEDESGAESCAEDASKKILDSDATDTPFIKSHCVSFGNSPSDISDTLHPQNSKPDNEISEDCVLLNGSCFVNPGMVSPGASLSGSMELQISEVESCHKYASVSPCEKEIGKIVNGRESSECSQFDDPLKKSGLDSDDQKSKMNLCKKRKRIDSEIQGSIDKPVAKILRSVKNIAVTVLRRRSMRLISK